MMRHFLFKVLGLFLIAVALAGTALGDDLPGWVSSAATGGTPTYEKDVPAVVLLNEQIVEMGGDGKLTTTERYALKILTRDGRGLAVARAFYLSSASKVKDMQGWLIRPDGTSKAYDKKAIVDIIADNEDVYNEGRVKVINATDDMDVGSVFAYTTVTEEIPLFYQDRWEFQSRFPVIRSRYSLNLPSGWTAASTTFNAPEVKPQVNGSSYVWEMRDLQPIPPEPMSPGVIHIAPRMVVTYSSPQSAAGTQSFTNWNDVSRWGARLHDPSVIVDDEVAAKARDLTANAKTELEKIRAIGKFVQDLQYISIDIGVGYGNGYRPRPSSTVLARGYGDCKDKANLMRALLRSIKIESYPVFIFSGDPTFVSEKWPSPRQFNHCIIAIKISSDTKATSVIEVAKLGRLLIFDATDPYTAAGDLPSHLQGSMALIAAGEAGDIAKMPLSEPETDLIERRVDVALDPLGNMTGKIVETMHGQASAVARREVRAYSAPQFRTMLEGWLTRGSTAAQLSEVNHTDDPEAGRFGLSMDFKLPLYGQVMQNRLLVFKPVVVSRRSGTSLTEVKRSSPIEIGASMMKETASIALPAGFAVDELPDPVNIETEFGKYTTTFEVKGEKLIFTRSLRTSRSMVPAAKYDLVKGFYTKIQEAEQQPVVLLRK